MLWVVRPGLSVAPLNTPISTLLARKRPGVHSVSPTFTVAEAVADMNHHKIGAVVVVDNGKLVGIFTERDVLKRVVGAGLDPQRARIAEVMTKEIFSVPSTATVEETMEIFTDRRCRHLPVVDNGQLQGVISIGDVTRWTVDMHRTEAEHLKNYIAGGLSN
jgi:CBS domain-containing protein